MSVSKKFPNRKASKKKSRKSSKARASRSRAKPAVRIRLRDQYQPASGGRTFSGGDASKTLRRVLRAILTGLLYPIIEVLDGDVTFVDLDTHHLERRPSELELAASAESLLPQPDAWWSTHGKGLRLVYVGPRCEERALAAAFSVPKWFEIELKRDSRHPRGAHPDYPAAQCGTVKFSTKKETEPSDWLAAGRLDEKVVDDLLSARGMQRGGRHDHSLCPIDGRAESNARDCVVALDAAIFCYRCAAKGLNFDSCHTPGLTPYAALAADAARTAVLHCLAQHLVHWAHAELHLRDEYPNLAAELLRQAYHFTLRAAHGDDDPRIPLVFDPDLRVLQSEHAWFDRETRTEVRITEYTLNALPGLLRLAKETDKNGKTKVTRKVRAPLLDRAKSGIPLDGYKPVRFIRGLALDEDDDVLHVVVGPTHGGAVELLAGKRLLSGDQAFAELVHSFPGLSRSYLQASLAAAICAARGGRPPIIIAVGPTGSGKGETPRLAASFLADDRQTLALVRNEDQVWRRIGSAVESGCRFLFFDEFLRRGSILPELIALVLQLSSVVTWRRLYANADIQTVNCAGYFLAAGCVPDGFKKSPEIRRRIWLARLHRQVEDWEEASGGDTAEWRARAKRNAQIANSILTHACRLCAEHDFNFDRVAEAIGLCRIDEGEAEAQRSVLRDLYRHCRDEFGDRVLHTAKRYRPGRWVDALSRPCQELLEQLVPDEDTDHPDTAGMVFQLQQNLQMVPWNAVLGIGDPPILAEMRRHGSRIAIRFRETGSKLRGQERINDELPPIPDDDPDDETGNPGEGGGPEPADSGGDPLCQLGHEGWRNGNPPDAVENAGNENAAAGSASYASSATLSEESTENNNEGASKGAEEGIESAKTLAQPAERRFDPTSGGKTPQSRASNVAQRLAQRPPPIAAGDPDRAIAALFAAGFPPQLLVIDFETYFDNEYSLKKLTIPEYVHDARFHVHGIAVRRPNGQREFRTDAQEALTDLCADYGDRLEAVTVVAHHMHFDGYILAKKFDLRPAYVTDTLAMARHVFPGVGNKLADLAARFGLAPKGDVLSELEGVRDLDVVQAAKLAAYAKHDANLCHDIASRLLPRISRPDVEIRLIDHTVRLFTERALPFDLDNARRLLREAQGRLQEVLAAAGIDRKTAGGKGLVKLLAEELAKDGRKVPTKPGKGGDIPALAKGDNAMTKLIDDPSPQVQRLARARLAVKSAPQVENRLKTMICVAESTGGVLPVPLKYYGAHTGRYSGDDGVNLQNLPAHVSGLATQIRGLLLAGEGHRLVIVDASQIEARVLAWLAGEDGLVQAFARGGDIYCGFASEVFGEKVRKPRQRDPGELKLKLAARRQLGKVAVLGLGYQMGEARFIKSVRANPDLEAMLASGALSEAFLAQVHRAYRMKHGNIVRYWHAMQDGFASVIQLGSSRVGRIEFVRDSDAVHVRLPSGRGLVYREPRVALSGDLEYAGGKVYGGLLVENVVQGIARDILVEAMLELERRGHQVVLTVHDEIVLRVPAGRAEGALIDAKACLSTAPSWADGLPLAADGRVADRYGK